MEEEESKTNEIENDWKVMNNNFFDNILKIFTDEKKIKINDKKIKKTKKVKNQIYLSLKENTKDQYNKISTSNDYIFYTNNILNCNSQIISKDLSDLIGNYKTNKSYENYSLINFIFSNIQSLYLKSDYLEVYLLYKILPYKNPKYISINLNIFE